VSDGSVMRVGADVVEVRSIAESIARFGDQYLTRIYTEHEISSCVGSTQVTAAGLAARFAAKEATIKVLRPTSHQPEWRSIEVVRQPEGWCSMKLSGYAEELASAAGICDLAVSLTHENEIAAAVVIGSFRPEAGCGMSHVSDAPDEHEYPGRELRDYTLGSVRAIGRAIGENGRGGAIGMTAPTRK
jgi:holo-[acyl-carrier protein] synthase